MHSSPPERRGKRCPVGNHDQLDAWQQWPAPGSRAEPSARPSVRCLHSAGRSPQLRQPMAKYVLVNLSDEGSFCVVTDAGEAADDPPVAHASTASPSLGRAAMAGLRQSVVAVLQLIALFTSISGKPFDGFLMLSVATSLIFDAARSRRQAARGGTSAAARAAPDQGLLRAPDYQRAH
jgi:hypothetical protein